MNTRTKQDGAAARPSPVSGVHPGQSRRTAAEIVADLAQRLADPATVAASATREGNLDHLPGGDPIHPWSGLTLGEGHPGVALLYAELSRDDPAYRKTAHAHLAAATRALTTVPGAGLFAGVPSLAFAARAARCDPHDYAAMLGKLDSQVIKRVQELITTEAERLGAGRAGTSMAAYDVIVGLAGLGRYLLLRDGRYERLLRDVLACLVRLTDPVRVHGHTVPGWWVPGPPGPGQERHCPRGHFNVGLAHGICGPLALFALAEEADVAVPGQRDAATRIVTWLLQRLFGGCRWPGVIDFDSEVRGAGQEPAGGRAAWCYGTPGVARAIFLAGRALGRPDWRRTAVAALAGVLDLPNPLGDCGLCHGWAGLLQITWRMARDGDDLRLAGHVPRLAARVIDGHDPELPFGYRYANTPPGAWAPHRAGFLEGAAGIALALHTYATDTVPAAGWDAALLLG
jgi:lantibiotic biosynthesis protein